MVINLGLALMLLVQTPNPRLPISSVSIELLEGVTVATKSPADFTLYEFKSVDGAIVLSAYAGFFPSFGGSAPAAAARRKFKIHGIPGERIEWRDDRGRSNVEVMLSPGKYGRLHLWYAGASAPEIKLAEALIASIQKPEK